LANSISWSKNQHLQDQKSKHIAEIRSLVRRSKQITNEEFRKKIKSIFKLNKKSYSSTQFGLLQIFILQVGQTSLRSAVECKYF
jgi:hypothetical protein